MELLLKVWKNYLVHIIDILVVSYLFYKVILFIKGTRALQILTGIIVLAFITVLAKGILGFKTLDWILSNFWVIGVIVISIVFQPELRSVFARLGSEPIERVFLATSRLEFLNVLIPSIDGLSARKTGAILVIEQDVRLSNFIETGTIINGELSQELLVSIFNHSSNLHDGAVILKENKIIAAGCILPLSESPGISKVLGTRHRAGLGISEVSDAIAIVISEETGSISLMYQGKMEYNIAVEELQKKLNELLRQKIEKNLVFKKNRK